MTRAYFISPDRVIIPVNQRHIYQVISHPEKFGFTREYVEELYKKHGEKLGMEGNAREELLLELVKRGWARVREYTSRDAYYWSIQVNEMNMKTKDMLQDFTEQAIKGKGPFKIDKKVSPNDEIRIVSLRDGKVVQDTFRNIAKYSLFNKDEKELGAKLKPIKQEIDILADELRKMTPHEREQYAIKKGWPIAQLRYMMYAEGIKDDKCRRLLEWSYIEDYQPKKTLVEYLDSF